MRTFTENEEREICSLYKKGKSKNYICKIYHCRLEAISNVLKNNNIKTRPFGLTKNLNIKEDFFEVIDSEEKAYFLGLLFTDGSISKPERTRSSSIRLQLKESDIKIIEIFKNILNIESKIYYDKRKNKESVVIGFRNQKMVNDLAKFGIIPNKTYLTNHLPEVPKKILKDFLRGLLDGDGSIYQETKTKKYRIDFCSYHKTICEDFKNYCATLIGEENTNTINNYGTAYHIRFNKQEIVRQLAIALYKDSKLSISRKQEMAEKIFYI